MTEEKEHTIMKSRRTFFYRVIMCCVVLGIGPAIHADTEIDQKVAALLSQMTLEEKVGQMTQITLGVVTAEGHDSQKLPELDMVKLEQAVVDYHVGSILNVTYSAFPLVFWHEVITTIQDVATQKTRLGIPVIYGIDAIHGANYTVGATIFPQSIGMAATWNRELVNKEGVITAYEVRASGIPWNFNPVLGMGRQPLWPRLWETYGEDPYLASVLGAEYVRGLEGDDVGSPDKIAACLKHYLGYSVPLTGKDRTPAWIPERMLREYFLPPFKAAVDAGAHTVMANSGEINGIPVHADYRVLTELLRGELGFEGFVVSDWEDVKRLYDWHKVADSPKEAVRMAVMAGMDMSMVPMDYSFYDLLLELVEEGSVPESRIDEAVGRILRVKCELGLFENPYPNPNIGEKFACDEFRSANLQAARESITLLKNERKLLPLPKNERVLVTGPTADMLSYLNNGWTITWQGDREDLYPEEKLTILEAIQEKIGEENVLYFPGTTITDEIDIQEAVFATKNAQVAVVCLGENTYCEGTGNITDLTLPQAQLQLVRRLGETGIPIVLVLVEGRPRIINSIVDDIDAILLAFLPGMEGGPAIADVLFGDYNPCGKLPITYPRYTNDFTLYDHTFAVALNWSARYNPQFPFGHGLSYTTFEYSDLVVSKEKILRGESIDVSVRVRNTGQREGVEVVQLYLSDLYASVTPPVKRLKGFDKVNLKPDEARTVTFQLSEEEMSFIGPENRPVVESGEFLITIGDLQKRFVLE